MINQDKIIPLSQLQNNIMQEFYDIEPAKVIFDKIERNHLWKLATKRSPNLDFKDLKMKCPALESQIQRSYKQGNNIQSAVFSECTYAQTFANMLKLDLFVDCSKDKDFIPPQIFRYIESYNLVPRYVYSTKNKERMLIQAGGCRGIDSALVTVIGLIIYSIEFKEPAAKTSEPDLPKYGENGKIKITKDFLERYPQFEAMLNEQKELNFFQKMGHNINNFSKESINIAVSNNYAKKYADVICTEDVNGYFVMLPANQVSIWANLEGEIRPSGRNHYKVWTPTALARLILRYNPTMMGKIVKIEKQKLEVRAERGGNGKISGYKITPLFFVYAKDCNDDGKYIIFDIMKVQQLNPTIAGKMFFKNLKYEKVKSYYQKVF
ncbi:hypothetical protein [Treponema pectinovorum]|uniref:hypothetical protein n=1 Tax=Treponema pectinovorum TaxID=164 RepID=UPI0011C926CD|nr:hypothetical protein [Treponema pectinovorum]